MPQSLEEFEQECKSVLGYNGDVWDVVQPYAPDPFFTASYDGGAVFYDVYDGVGTWVIGSDPASTTALRGSGPSLREAIRALQKAANAVLEDVDRRIEKVRGDAQRASDVLRRLRT